MKENPPRNLPIPAELEEHIREHAPEFLARAVESAAKRGLQSNTKPSPLRRPRTVTTANTATGCAI